MSGNHEVDDETDADLTSVLKDFIPPEGFDMVNMERVPGASRLLTSDGKYVTVLRRIKLNKVFNQPGMLNASLSQLFSDVYTRLCYSTRAMRPCQILSISHNINISEEDTVELLVAASEISL